MNVADEAGAPIKLAVMQPYFFPYLGYFQLIAAADRFLIYDDVNFIKQGWINRNRILGSAEPERITLQVLGASSNRRITEVTTGGNRNRLLRTIEQKYSKAPYFSGAWPVIRTIMDYPENNLARFVGHSLGQLCRYMGIATQLGYSSDLGVSSALAGQDRLIEIACRLGAGVYINPIGGTALYGRLDFARAGIELRFLKMRPISYPQFGAAFQPNLSCIDVMMFNSPAHIARLLTEFDYVSG